MNKAAILGRATRWSRPSPTEDRRSDYSPCNPLSTRVLPHRRRSSSLRGKKVEVTARRHLSKTADLSCLRPPNHRRSIPFITENRQATSPRCFKPAGTIDCCPARLTAAVIWSRPGRTASANWSRPFSALTRSGPVQAIFIPKFIEGPSCALIRPKFGLLPFIDSGLDKEVYFHIEGQ